MKYDYTNCDRKCRVATAEGVELREVESVDTAGWQVVQYEIPFRVVDDEPVRITRKFSRADIVFDRFGLAASITLHGLQP